MKENLTFPDVIRTRDLSIMRLELQCKRKLYAKINLHSNVAMLKVGKSSFARVMLIEDPV